MTYTTRNTDLAERLIEKLSKDEKAKRKKKAIMGVDTMDGVGYDQHLKALGHGVIKDACQGSPLHGQDGKFATHKSDGSWSKQKGCDGAGQYKRKGKKRLGNREPCGRKSTTHPRKLCKENDMDDHESIYRREALAKLIKDTIRAELGRIAKSRGCSMNDILTAMNRIEQASSGDLNKGSKN